MSGSSRKARIGRGRNWSGGLFVLVNVAIYFFLAFPLLVVIGGSFSPEAHLTFPPSGISLRWYEAVFNDGQWLDSFVLSAILLVIVAPVSVLLVAPAAYVIARSSFPGKSIINMIVMAPLMVPQIMLGLAMLFIFTRWGLIDSRLGLVIGHTVTVLPFVFRIVLFIAMAVPIMFVLERYVGLTRSM